MNKIRLAIIENVKSIRDNLKEYFESQEETEYLFVCDSLDSLFEKIKWDHKTDTTITNIQADIVLIDMNEIEQMRRIEILWPHANIIMLTTCKDHNKIFKSAQSGAIGYIMKDTAFHLIKKAIIGLSNGGTYISPSITRNVILSSIEEESQRTFLLKRKDKSLPPSASIQA